LVRATVAALHEAGTRRCAEGALNRRAEIRIGAAASSRLRGA
jgi:hypothetical protein